MAAAVATPARLLLVFGSLLLGLPLESEAFRHRHTKGNAARAEVPSGDGAKKPLPLEELPAVDGGPAAPPAAAAAEGQGRPGPTEAASLDVEEEEQDLAASPPPAAAAGSRPAAVEQAPPREAVRAWLPAGDHQGNEGGEATAERQGAAAAVPEPPERGGLIEANQSARAKAIPACASPGGNTSSTGCRRGRCYCSLHQRCYPHHLQQPEGAATLGEDIGICELNMTGMVIATFMLFIIVLLLLLALRFCLIITSGETLVSLAASGGTGTEKEESDRGFAGQQRRLPHLRTLTMIKKKFPHQISSEYPVT